MSDFIYCFDDSLTDKLIAQGFFYMNKIKINNKDAWVFANNNNLFKILQFENSDKYLIYKTLTF